MCELMMSRTNALNYYSLIFTKIKENLHHS